MSWLRPTNSFQALIALLGCVGLIVAVMAVMDATDVHMILPLRLALALGTTVPAAWYACRYWCSLDEAAREAQRWAWYWGGSAGMAIGIVAISAIGTFFGDLIPPASPAKMMIAGAALLFAGQMVGFVGGWAYWWWVRR